MPTLDGPAQAMSDTIIPRPTPVVLSVVDTPTVVSTGGPDYPPVLPPPIGSGSTPTPVATAGGSSNVAHWIGGLLAGAAALFL